MDEGGVLELVGLAYSASHDRAHWPRYLERLRAHTGAAATFLLGADLTGSDAGVLEGPLASSEADRRYQEYYHRIDEFALAYLRSGIRPGQVWGSHQLIPDAQMAASEFYNDLLRHFDYFYCAGGILVQEGASMVGFGILRSRRQGAPEPDAMRLLGALMPHQQRAMQIDRRLRQLEAAQRLTGGIMDALPYGLIALDRRGRVVAMNRMAEDIVAARDGLRLGPGGLAGLRPREDGMLRQAIAAALSATPSGGAVELPRPSHPRPLRLVLAPVPRERPPLGLDDPAAAALIFVHDPERRAPTRTDVLRRLYRLTPQQARLSEMLAGGASLAEAAERLGVAGETATSHLKQVFRKTGVRRQAELIRLLLSLPPGDGA